jgi:hypothetical protein
MILLVAMVSLVVPAAASGPALGGTEVGEDGDVVQQLRGPAWTRRVNSDGAVQSDSRRWAGIPRLGSFMDDDGEVVYCRDIQWVALEEGEDRAQRIRDANSGFLALFGGLPELQGHNPYLPCPTDPADSIPPAMVQDAVLHTIEDQLPRPTLEVPQGYALTGMPAYLVTNHELEYGPVTHSVDLGVMIVDVTVTASGVTHVDWGDGHADTYHSPGTPWPEGEVRHTYINTGTVTITVTDTWEVTYRVPALGIEDSVTAPLAPRTLDGLEIQQVQAVRTSSDR